MPLQSKQTYRIIVAELSYILSCQLRAVKLCSKTVAPQQSGSSWTSDHPPKACYTKSVESIMWRYHPIFCGAMTRMNLLVRSHLQLADACRTVSRVSGQRVSRSQSLVSRWKAKVSVLPCEIGRKARQRGKKKKRTNEKVAPSCSSPFQEIFSSTRFPAEDYREHGVE